MTQHTWLGIIKGLRRLNDPAGFRAWAYRITTNQAMGWLKKNRGSTRSIADHPEPTSPETADPGLMELLPKLDLKKRLALSLFYLEQTTGSSTCLQIPVSSEGSPSLAFEAVNHAVHGAHEQAAACRSHAVPDGRGFKFDLVGPLAVFGR